MHDVLAFVGVWFLVSFASAIPIAKLLKQRIHRFPEPTGPVPVELTAPLRVH